MIDGQRFKMSGSAYDRPEASFDADIALVTKGTPAGEMLRRYWHPVSLSSKVQDLPLKIRVLGEDLVLFRKPNGDCGLVYPRCMHRGTDLIYGKVTDKGIRCCYHGWTFETDGRCTDQPREPGGGLKRDAVRQPWYPVEERYGMVFAYMGPLDKKPALPQIDILEDIPEGWELGADDTTIPAAGAGYMPCNWLQHHENGIDGEHVPIVHADQFPPMLSQADVTFSAERHHYGVLGLGYFKLGEMGMRFSSQMIFPTIRVTPNPMLSIQRPDGRAHSVHWTLPKDDTDTIVFTAWASPKGFGYAGSTEEPAIYGGKTWNQLDAEEHQRFPGDFEAQVGQGPISLHSEEHLATSDIGIMMYRRMLRDAIKDVQEGRDPPFTSDKNETTFEVVARVEMFSLKID